MAIDYADVLVGLQAGDEGKGKVAHHLAASDEYDMVLRYNGGANAGHTVYHNGKKIVTHQVPIGVLHGKVSIIGPGCVVDIPALVKEIKELNTAGIKTDGLIFVDKRTHVVTGDHLYEDKHDTKIGTTKRGIGPAYRDKYNRTGITMGQLEDHNNPYDWPDCPFEIIDIYKLLHQSTYKYRVLCEGAQGFHLDIDWGEYPYVTSSHCTVGSACLNGIPPHKIRRVYGVMKAYETYVGNRTDFTDESNPIFQEIQTVGNEFGATTARPRKVNWMNLDRAIQAMQINGVSHMIINKADVLQEVGKFGLIYHEKEYQFTNYVTFNAFVTGILHEHVNRLATITWSLTPNGI
jgi:adenylosuccinate synthase